MKKNIFLILAMFNINAGPIDKFKNLVKYTGTSQEIAQAYDDLRQAKRSGFEFLKNANRKEAKNVLNAIVSKPGMTAVAALSELSRENQAAFSEIESIEKAYSAK